MNHSNVPLKISFQLNCENNYEKEYVISKDMNTIHSDNCLVKGKNVEHPFLVRFHPLLPSFSIPELIHVIVHTSGFT